ncbi:MAG: lamin tail domain-containing protein [Caldilineaceae bacterium]
MAGAGSSLVINEVDADTPGTDLAEFIEIFDGGVGNVALDGYVVVLFNGSNDQAYYAVDLDGYSTDANGYLVVGNSAVASAVITFADSTLQQGADAVALYQGNAADFPNGTAVTTGNLVDALVYDTSDPDDAELLTLLNPGQPQVNEAGGGNSADDSSQRCANGSGGQRNTVTFVQIPPSPGAMNNCSAVQPTMTPTPTNTPVTPTPTSSITPETGLIINEVDVDTPSSDTAEFVELYDGGTGNTPLDGLVIVFYDGTDDEAYLALDLDGLATNGDGYFVAGNPAVASAVITFADGRMQNGADAVALYIGSASDFVANTPLTTTNLLDAVVYGTDDADDAGLLTLLLSGGQMNEAGARNAVAVAMGRCANGSGGQRNTSTLALISPSPNEPNNCGAPLPTLTPTPTPSAPTATPTTTATPTVNNATPTPTLVVANVLINEVDANSTGADTAEFVELVGAPGAAPMVSVSLPSTAPMTASISPSI